LLVGPVLITSPYVLTGINQPDCPQQERLKSEARVG